MVTEVSATLVATTICNRKEMDNVAKQIKRSKAEERQKRESQLKKL
jgi:hypothetical protein